MVESDWTRLCRFIVDHDITVTETRSALSFCRDRGLQSPVSFHLPGFGSTEAMTCSIPTDECLKKMYLLIYHRLGVVCPELVRVFRFMNGFIVRRVSKLMKMTAFRFATTIKKV